MRTRERRTRTHTRRAVGTYLSGGVYDVTIIVGTVVRDGLGKGAFDGGVVGFDKGIVDELNHERGLA